jgi:hypothetical protein
VRVLCTANQGSALPRDYLDARVNLTPQTLFPLTPGQEYVVYAATFLGNQVWYYLVDDDNLWYPHRRPAPLFQIVDARLSQYWRYSFTPGHLDHLVLLAFDEWVSNVGFYDRLSDRDDAEVQVFRRRKAQLDAECS